MRSIFQGAAPATALSRRLYPPLLSSSQLSPLVNCNCNSSAKVATQPTRAVLLPPAPASCHPPPASFPSACIKNELNLMLRCLATTGVVSSSVSVLVPLQVRCPRSCLAVPLCTPSGAHCDMQQESTASARNSIYTNFSNVSSLQNLLLDRKDFSSE